MVSSWRLNLDTRQTATDKNVLAVSTNTAPAQPIKPKEIHGKSSEQGKFYTGKGFYLIIKLHSHRRPNMEDSNTHLKRIIDKHLIPYLLLPNDAIKEWLTLKNQVT
ncbi:hypothetical protein C1H46_025969 [Malus baccata]|uniref:Uncharacterized protein n=1 Tax=Malus baccata TaxID=106549 RepID=A0A540LPQ3_MALBA|nr:hypothetical protein C1H46_025969 [Malus baccata]